MPFSALAGVGLSRLPWRLAPLALIAMTAMAPVKLAPYHAA